MAPPSPPPPSPRKNGREVCGAFPSLSLSLSLLSFFLRASRIDSIKRNLMNDGGLVKIGLASSDRVDGCQRAAILSAEISAKRGFRGLSSPDIP